MSYDISLLDPVTHKVIQFDTPHQIKGGMYCMGGTTEGNAKRALCGLLSFAKMRPDGIWDGD